VTKFSGLFPPIPTPFVHGEFSPERFSENLARWNAHAYGGYVVLGSNGEAPLIDDDERAAVIRTARRAIPRDRLMIVGTGRESTRAAARSTREAFDLGADAVLVGVPSYYRPAMNDGVLLAHYMAVADAAAGPVLLYSVPVFTGIPLSVSLFERSLGHDRVSGIKDSSGDEASLRSFIEGARRHPRPASVLVGNARLLAAGLSMGATGAVLAVSSVAPGLCRTILSEATGGLLESALSRNSILAPLSDAVTRTYGVGGLKHALDLLGYYGGDPRPPLQPPSAAAREDIHRLMESLELLSGR